MSVRVHPSGVEKIADARRDVIVAPGPAGNTTETATDATHGFLFIPTVNGTPTGTPANAPTGAAAIVFDRSGNKIWVYDGGWIGVAVS